jgi:hypothetical protein
MEASNADVCVIGRRRVDPIVAAALKDGSGGQLPGTRNGGLGADTIVAPRMRATSGT